MRTILIRANAAAMMLLACLCGSCDKQEGNEQEGATSVAGPASSVSANLFLKPVQTVINFGIVPEGTLVERKYRLNNVSKSKIRIEAVIPSCGCIVPKLQSKEIDPGETLELDVTFDTTGRYGERQNNILVRSRRLPAGEMENTKLILAGRVLANLYINPSFIDFGRVSVGNTYEATFDVVSETRKSINVRTVTAYPDFKIDRRLFHDRFSVLLDPSQKYSNKCKVVIKLRPIPGWPSGQAHCKIVFSDSSIPMQSISIAWTIEEPILASPPSIVAFGEKQVVREITISPASTMEVLPEFDLDLTLDEGELKEIYRDPKKRVFTLLVKKDTDKNSVITSGAIEIRFDKAMEYPRMKIPIVVTWRKG